VNERIHGIAAASETFRQLEKALLKRMNVRVQMRFVSRRKSEGMGGPQSTPEARNPG
jgi:hypothetical protein